MTNPTNAPAPTSYREAYRTLERVVQQLEQGNADLDDVLPLLDEARAAYAVCQQRVQAITAALEQAEWLQGSEAEGDEVTDNNEAE